jgi:hypothetical protein
MGNGPTFGVGSTVAQVLEAEPGAYYVSKAPIELSFEVGHELAPIKVQTAGIALFRADVGLIVFVDPAGRVVDWKQHSSPTAAVREEPTRNIQVGQLAVNVLEVLGPPDEIEASSSGFRFCYGAARDGGAGQFVTFDSNARVIEVSLLTNGQGP